MRGTMTLFVREDNSRYLSRNCKERVSRPDDGKYKSLVKKQTKCVTDGVLTPVKERMRMGESDILSQL